MICIISLLLVCGCTTSKPKPEEEFKEIFTNTSNDDIFLWVPDLEKIDKLTQTTQKRYDLSHASKLKNDDSLSYYQKFGIEEELHEKSIELLESLKLKETEKFERYRILLRIGCEKEEKDFLVIYDDMLAKIIHIDKNLEVHEEYYQVESVSAIEDFIAYVDSLIDE